MKNTIRLTVFYFSSVLFNLKIQTKLFGFTKNIMEVLAGLLAGPALDFIKDVGSSVYHDIKNGTITDLSSFGDSIIAGGKKALGIGTPHKGAITPNITRGAVPSNSKNQKQTVIETEPIVGGLPAPKTEVVTVNVAKAMNDGKRRKRRFRM
jgi:hypothetical protein